MRSFTTSRRREKASNSDYDVLCALSHDLQTWEDVSYEGILGGKAESVESEKLLAIPAEKESLLSRTTETCRDFNKHGRRNAGVFKDILQI